MDGWMVTLTALIAGATAAQAIFAWRLWSLQESQEKERQRVDVVVTFKAVESTYFLQTVNLSAHALWADRASIQLTNLGDGQSKDSGWLLWEEVVPSYETGSLNVHRALQGLLPSPKNPDDRQEWNAKFSARLVVNGSRHSGENVQQIKLVTIGRHIESIFYED